MRKRTFLTSLSLLILISSFSQEKPGNLSQDASNALNPIAQVIKF